MQSSRISHKTICDYDRLEKAFFSLDMEMTEENEIGLMNLHNHLIWHSYEPGKEPAADAILLAVISDYRILFLEHGKKDGEETESSRKEGTCKAEE